MRVATAASHSSARNTSKKVPQTAATEEAAAVSSSKQFAARHPCTNSRVKGTSKPGGVRMGKEKVKEVSEGKTMSLPSLLEQSSAKYGVKIQSKKKQNGYA